MRIDWHKHIAVDSDIHHGEPCIKGTRVPVSLIVGCVADGMTFDEILDAYPQLKKESIQAPSRRFKENKKHKRNRMKGAQPGQEQYPFRYMHPGQHTSLLMRIVL